MKRSVLLVLALAACTEHGESPSSENIRVGRLDCTLDTVSVQFVAEIDVTLDIGQGIRATFLPDLDGVQFFRSTVWDCASWTDLAGFMGCARDSSASGATDTVTVTETNEADTALPTSFDYTAIVSIIDMNGIDIENVQLAASCP